MNRKGISALIWIIVGLIVVFAIYYAWPQISGAAIMGVSCIDSDSKNDIYVRGDLIFTDTKGRVFDDIYTDKCTADGLKVEQRYCTQKNGNYYVEKEVYLCPSNKCVDGACKLE